MAGLVPAIRVFWRRSLWMTTNRVAFALSPPIIIQHEDADGRGQIAAASRAIDRSDQFGQALPPQLRDLFQRGPERIFDADAGLVARDHNRALDHRRFHSAVPIASRPSISGPAGPCAPAAPGDQTPWPKYSRATWLPRAASCLSCARPWPLAALS